MHTHSHSPIVTHLDQPGSHLAHLHATAQPQSSGSQREPVHCLLKATVPTGICGTCVSRARDPSDLTSQPAPHLPCCRLRPSCPLNPPWTISSQAFPHHLPLSGLGFNATRISPEAFPVFSEDFTPHAGPQGNPTILTSGLIKVVITTTMMCTGLQSLPQDHQPAGHREFAVSLSADSPPRVY